MILFACLLGGTAVVLVAPIVGWGNTEDNGFYFLLTFGYFPMSGTAYLVLFALISRRAARPRLWAYLLLPIFWGFLPFFAILIIAPPVAATWAALLVYARWVEVPARTAPPVPTGAQRYVGAPWGPT